MQPLAGFVASARLCVAIVNTLRRTPEPIMLGAGTAARPGADAPITKRGTMSEETTGRGRHAAETSSEHTETSGETGISRETVSGEYTETENSRSRDTDVEGEYTESDDTPPISSEEKGSYVDTESHSEDGPEGEYTDADQ